MIDRKPSPARRLAAVAGAVLLLGGCVEEPRMGEGHFEMAVTKQTELPPPTGADIGATTTPYRIGPFDKLSITVFGAPDLSGTMQTDAAARISMPLVGEVDASGQTPIELATTLSQRLSHRYMRDPQVTVNLEETTSQVVTIDGQVTQPGSYPVVGSMSLMRAVATAKGVSEFARMDDVVVFRTVNGQPMAALYNLGDIRRGRYPDPKIYANDVIIVGDSKARHRIQEFLQVGPLLTTPLILALERFN